MTEAEWHTLAHARPLLNCLRDKASNRKLRLFACACCQTWEPIRNDPDASKALEMMERYADGLIPRPDYVPTRRDALQTIVRSIRSRHAYSTACNVNHDLGHRLNAWIVRDIFGNPFQPVVLDPAWLTSTVMALAKGIYEERAFDRMPILADALQDAGCDTDDILTHCRGPGPHVRGCQVIDLVLGKQ
jgi:hypothetical protein